ncbi:MAG TPA: hypothetical protein VIG67_07180 [Yaniella sp.]
MTVHRPARRFRLTALFITALFALAACGAEVSSELSISDDESGTRKLVATIVEEDLEYLDGGIEATEAALSAQLPEQLSFEGITPATDAEEEDAGEASESYLATFELEFSDLADYRSKAQALIDLAVEQEGAESDDTLGDFDSKTVEVAFEQSDGPLLDGIVLEENFTGAELLEWTSYALVEEGVVAEEDAASIISSTGTESRVIIGEEEYESSEPFSISEGTDNRFSSVNVTITDSGATVDMTSSYDADDAADELAQQYLEDTGVGQVEESSEGSWTVALDESASLQEQLSGLLEMDDLEIQVEESANTEEGTLLTTLTGTGFSCPAVCIDIPYISLDWGSDDLTPVDETVDGTTFTISYERAVRIDQVEIDTEVGLSGTVGQTYRFTVGSSQVEAFGEDLQSIFTPPEGTGSVETEAQDDATIFIATLDAAEPAELNATLDEFLPGSAVTLDGFDGIWPNYRVVASSFGVEALGVTPEQNLQLPFMHSADQDASSGVNADLNAEQTEYLVVASGPTLTGLITLGVLVVVLVVAIVLIVVFRKRIAAGLRSAQAHSQAAAQQRNATEPTAVYATSPAGLSVELLEDDAAWQADFTEAKLH